MREGPESAKNCVQSAVASYGHRAGRPPRRPPNLAFLNFPRPMRRGFVWAKNWVLRASVLDENKKGEGRVTLALEILWEVE